MATSTTNKDALQFDNEFRFFQTQELFFFNFSKDSDLKWYYDKIKITFIFLWISKRCLRNTPHAKF